MVNRRTLYRVVLLVCALLLAPAGFSGLAGAQTVNPDDVTYLLPFWAGYGSATDAQVEAEIEYMRTNIGEGPYFRLGFTSYVFISMNDWTIDTSNPAAIRAALASTISQIDGLLAKARRNNVPISLMFLTAIRQRYDPVQRASENEDVRSMQWYADNIVAAGWWTHTKYARKARRIQEAYLRELGKIVANRMKLYQDILVAATGDGEVELAGARCAPDAECPLETPNIYADYSPFAVAEFRDWIRHAGIYDSGAEYAGKGYANGARYAGDATPGEDTNGDGHTLNGDFGTNFSTWNLLHFDWSLDDPYLANDPQAVSFATYLALVNLFPEGVPDRFDAPRAPQEPGVSAWWDLWVLFRQVMLQHHNTEFAKWMTTSVDPETGATIPTERWFSDQIPADYLFGTTPENPGDRFTSSASAFWTGDVRPYGSLGITAFNLDGTACYPGWVAATLRNVAPQIGARDQRWGIIEWHPGVRAVLWDTGDCVVSGESTDLELYRSEMAAVERYRPTLLQPFTWNSAPFGTKGTPFETALKELADRIKDGSPPAPRLEMDAVGSNGHVTQPFELRGWAVDLGKIRGPGRGPGIDQVHVYAYPNPGSAAAPIFLGIATYGSARADLASAYGTQFTNSGFTLTIRTLPAGRYRIVAYGRSTVSLSFNAANSVTLDVEVTMTAAPASLRFLTTKGGATGQILAATPAQSVTLLYDGPGTPAWTATADQPWVQLTNASGSGPGQFAVSIANPRNVIGAATSLAATITVTAANVNATPTLVPVTLTVDQSGASTAPPFGMVETPSQNAAGIVGSIGLTGWALDDAGISSVTLYRNCLPFEPADNCGTVAGRRVVFVGTADIVPGARPDVEAAYPSYPQNYRAGWGYLLLTNMLPDIPGEVMYGGRGRIEISVLATDVEGHQQWLGRTVFDQTTTAITMANDSAAKPFGAIDTPGQGQVVSGGFWNFGWALTPDNDATAGAGDIEVPASGATMWVWIDGAPVGNVIYNLCRGTVGSPPAAGEFCNDDVSNIFGNPTPQDAFTTRTSNPTKYRNLDAGRGAIGGYFIDTTTMTNGRHSIVWSVTDNQGRVDGVGSRDFIVINGGSSLVSSSAVAADISRDAAWLDSVPPDADAVVHGRTGWDVWASLITVPADAAGVRHIQLPELGRLELRLGDVEAGYLVANGTLRDLPPGSRLDARDGVFTWAPALGYFGTYRLVFLRGGRQLPVSVSIEPLAVTPEGEAEIRMHLDLPQPGTTSSGSLFVAGWALDPRAAIGSGVDAIHVWAQRRDLPEWPQFLGVASPDVARPDVGAVFGPQFEHAGFGMMAPALEPGVYDITAFAWNRRTARWEDARTVSITIR